MTDRTDWSLLLRVVAVDPPLRDHSPLLFGLQDRHGQVDAVPAVRTTSFETHLQVTGTDDDGLDFRGDHVHGRKGDRFVYLSWGLDGGTEPYVMLARAKIKLAGIPVELLPSDGADPAGIECRVAATNAKDQPASGTIKTEAISWHPLT